MSITGGFGSGGSGGGTPSGVNSVNGKTGDVNLDKDDLNLNSVDNTSDLNKPVSTLQQQAINQAIEDSKEYSDELQAITNIAIDFLKESDLIEAPVVVWVNLQEIDLNSSVNVSPNVVSGTYPLTFEIVSGSLPDGLTFDSSSGLVSGTTSTSGTGSVVFKTSNLKGEYIYPLNWEVKEAQGAVEFLNSGNKYPYLICNESDFDNLYFIKLENVMGAINSSYVYDNSYNSQVFYHPYDETTSDGYNHAYLMQHKTSSYWYMFRSNYSPDQLVNGLDLADNLSSSAYELASPDSEEVVVDGVTYPCDRDIHYLTHPNYIEVGNDSSLDGFLSSNQVWSFGFKAQEDLPDDFLGRSLFEREGGNFIGYKSLSNSYEYVIFGKSQSSSYYDSIDSFVGVINSGDHVQFVFNGSNLEFRVNGLLKNSTSLSSFYFETDTISNIKKVNFGKSSISNLSFNDYNNQYKFLSYFQGLIADLWIANGVAFDSTQCVEISNAEYLQDSANYTSITHHWGLEQQEGSVFTSIKGGLTAYGKKNTNNQ